MEHGDTWQTVLDASLDTRVRRLLKRIESLERWRRNSYGTYKATDADYREWSGREPEEWAEDGSDGI